MKIYRVVATIEDACGENKEIDFIHEAATLDGAYDIVMKWLATYLKPGHNHMIKEFKRSAPPCYTILPEKESGPDNIYSCWVEEGVLYGYKEKEEEVLFE